MKSAFTDDFINLLIRIYKNYSDPIAKYLINANNSDLNTERYSLISHIDYNTRQQCPLTSLSFTPAKKEPIFDIDGELTGKDRQTATSGRVIRGLIQNTNKAVTSVRSIHELLGNSSVANKVLGNGPCFNDKDYENFINRLKSSRTCEDSNLVLVSGEKIRECYHEDNYAGKDIEEEDDRPGTLWQSCMRHDDCQVYMDVYVDNAELLVLYDCGEVTGRALVWQTDQGTFMDRIYYMYDYDKETFINYARENKWLYKRCQDSSSNKEVMRYDDKMGIYIMDNNMQLKVRLAPRDELYDSMPYMDTFEFYSVNENTLANYHPKYDTLVLNTKDVDGLEDLNNIAVCEYSGDYAYDYNLCETIDGKLVSDTYTRITRSGETVLMHDDRLITLENDYGYVLKGDANYVEIDDHYYFESDPALEDLLETEEA